MTEEDYRKLSDREIDKELSELVGWRVADGKLNKTIEFATAAPLQEQCQHLATSKMLKTGCHDP